MGGRGSKAIRMALGAAGGGTTGTAGGGVEAQAGGGGGGAADQEREFRTASDREMRKQYRKGYEKLTDKQRETLKDYQTAAGHFYMNAVARNSEKAKSLTPAQRKEVLARNRALSKILKENQTHRDLTVFRGTNILDDKDFAKATTVGAVFRDKGFVSTSLSSSVASTFVDGFKPNKVFFTVKVRKGTNSMYMDANKKRGQRSYEKELLLPKGAKFRVVGKLRSKSVYDDIFDQRVRVPHYLIEVI